MKNQKNLLFILPLIILLFMNFSSNHEENKFKFDLLADNMNFPEGPAWDGLGNLYVSSCYGGFITKITQDSVMKYFIKADTTKNFKQTNGLTVYKDGFIYACEYGFGNIMKISPEGEYEIIAEKFEGKRFNRPNDLAFDNKGNLYFTDPKSYDKNNRDGSIYRLNLATRKVYKVYEGLAFPNGIAFSQNFDELFVCESAMNRVLKYKVNENGELSEMKVFVEMPGGDPDGIAFDIEGNLYVAHFGGSSVYVFDKNGKEINKIKTPGKKPSNVEFGGDDMKTLYVTEDETNCVYKTNVEISGLNLNR